MGSHHLLKEEKDTDLHELQSRINQRTQTLHYLERTFAGATSSASDAEEWQTRIRELGERSFNKKTIVGVVGATGAGKSSLINAVLDEHRLLQTSCMSACTAAVTEISWNPRNDPEERYAAIVEFISAEEWETELRNLLGDLFSGQHVNIGDEAEVAWAKLHSIYPWVTKPQLCAQTVEQLLLDSEIGNVLGRKDHIRESTPTALNKRLESYTSAKAAKQHRGVSPASLRASATEQSTVELWPLIKSVKIYTKSDALSTGIVLVDLPGVHDSNPARAAVAQNYLKRCDALWIVSPITRAIHDKSASDLLSQQFQTQMRMDGLDLKTTLVCSKTDDISDEEVISQLSIEDRVYTFFEELEKLESGLEEIVKDIHDRLVKQDPNVCLDTSPPPPEFLASNATVMIDYSAQPRRSERLRSSSSNCSYTRFFGTDPIHLDDTALPTDAYSVLKALLHRTSGEEHNVCRRALQDYEQQRDLLRLQIRQICIQERNNYSKYKVRENFKTELMELHHAAAMEDDADDSSMEEDESPRDYDITVNDLPVFCVSTRAYEHFHGQSYKAWATLGFVDKAQTEIPLLQNHCKSLTRATQLAFTEGWLNDFDQLLDSLALWANNVPGSSDDARRVSDKQMQKVHRHFKELKDGLVDVIETSLLSLSDSIQVGLHDVLTAAAQKAQSLALETTTGWGESPADSQVGMRVTTYRATMRRNGVFTGRQGPRNLNEHLVRPMKSHVANRWSEILVGRVPIFVKGFNTSTSHLMKHFIDVVKKLAESDGAYDGNLKILSKKLPRYTGNFKDLGTEIEELIAVQQREANRKFEDDIRAHMSAGYTACGGEHGEFSSL